MRNARCVYLIRTHWIDGTEFGWNMCYPSFVKSSTILESSPDDVHCCIAKVTSERSQWISFERLVCMNKIILMRSYTK